MTESTLILFLPSGDGAIARARMVDGRIVADDQAQPFDGERVIAIAPADAVALHWADLGGLAAAQARAAARLIAAEHSLSPAGGLHVALGGEGEGRIIAAVSADTMAGWIAALNAESLDPDAIIPAPLLLPRPDAGYVRAIIGGVPVIRGTDSGFVDEPAITAALVGAEPVATLSDAALAAALEDPPLDLRQGAFAKRRRWRLDWPLMRRLILIAVAILAVTLLILLVQIVRTNFAADTLERRADTLTQTGLPRGVPVTDPQRQLDARLAGLRGGGLGFGAMAGTVFTAVQATPNVELSGLDFAPDGLLRVTVLAPGAPEVEALRSRIEQAGLDVEASPFQSEAGRIRGEFRVRAR